MLVKHLIRELNKFSHDVEVMTEGCDCYGDTYCVRWLDEDRDTVMIQRSGGFDFNDSTYVNSNDTPLPYPDDYGETVII